MTQRILFVSNTAIFAKFNIPVMRYLKSLGWVVDYASPAEVPVLYCDNSYRINMARHPLHYKNYLGYWELKTLLCANNYDIIHCHTPVGALLTRLAARNIDTKIIYTAHGFHFFKNAPLHYWWFFYPVEKLLAKYTDCLITINHEDFVFSKAHFNIPLIIKIDGVGIDLRRFHPVTDMEKKRIREKYNYDAKAFIVLYVAELIPRKNHLHLIKQIKKLQSAIQNLTIIFAGNGMLKSKLIRAVKRRVLHAVVDFVEYCDDIEYFYQMADVHVSPSNQEGRGMNNIEAMASGIPVVASKIRGHVDSIAHGRNGFLFELCRPDAMVDRIVEIYGDSELRLKIAQNNRVDAAKFDEALAVEKIVDCYGLSAVAKDNHAARA
jgi:glycosyltransferase EpsD